VSFPTPTSGTWGVIIVGARGVLIYGRATFITMVTWDAEQAHVPYPSPFPSSTLREYPEVEGMAQRWPLVCRCSSQVAHACPGMGMSPRRIARRIPGPCLSSGRRWLWVESRVEGRMSSFLSVKGLDWQHQKSPRRLRQDRKHR